MRIEMICPAPAGTRYGNRVTALRWVGILRHLGHRVRIAERWEGKPCDLLLALHAWRSAETVLRFGRLHPEKPVLVALTGTDLYRDIHRHREAQQALERASRLGRAPASGGQGIASASRSKDTRNLPVGEKDENGKNAKDP